MNALTAVVESTPATPAAPVPAPSSLEAVAVDGFHLHSFFTYSNNKKRNTHRRHTTT